MQEQEIYWRLLSTGDKDFALYVVQCSSCSPFLKIWALIKLGRKSEAKGLFALQESSNLAPFEEMLYWELRLWFNFGRPDVSTWKQQALTIVNRFPDAIYARLELARFERRSTTAISYYEDILKRVPQNLQALTGLASRYLYEHDKKKAASVLELIKKEGLVSKLSTREKIYWTTIIKSYEIVLGKMVELRLVTGIFFFLMGFFPQTIWVILSVMCIVVLFALYFLPRDFLVAATFFLLAILALLTWLAGRSIIFLDNL